MKSFATGLVASLATAALLGIALASPQVQKPKDKPVPRTLHVKLECIQARPRVVDTLIVTVDDGEVASISRPAGSTHGIRSVTVSPRLLEGNKVTMDVDLRNSGGKVDHLRTHFTMDLDETKVISAVTTREGSSSNEEMLFVTPSL